MNEEFTVKSKQDTKKIWSSNTASCALQVTFPEWNALLCRLKRSVLVLF